jgi:hypothetical protein
MAGEIPPVRAILPVAGNGAKSDLSEKNGAHTQIAWRRRIGLAFDKMRPIWRIIRTVKLPPESMEPAQRGLCRFWPHISLEKLTMREVLPHVAPLLTGARDDRERANAYERSSAKPREALLPSPLFGTWLAEILRWPRVERSLDCGHVLL